jgi:translocation and assembly module TamB
VFGSILTHISKRTLHTILAVAFGLIVLFFALTRTQVGRDQLGRQLEVEFSNRFQGELQIGQLTGNLLNTLYARNVEISDSLGSVVVHIDSLIIRPKWTYLLQKKFSLHNLTLIRPRVEIRFDENGSSNVANAFRRADSTSEAVESTWRLQGAAIEVLDGQVITSSPAPLHSLIQSRRVFDIGNTTLSQVMLRANLDISASSKQIDILRLNGRFPEPSLAIESGESQVVIRDGRIAINQFGLKIGNSDVSLSGFWDASKEGQKLVDRPFVVDVESENIDFSELKSFFPTTPMGGSASLSAHVQGPLSDVTISWIKLRRNDSFLELAGTFSGYPDELEVDLSLSNSTLEPADLNVLLPFLDWSRFLEVRSVSTSAYLQGNLGLDAGSISYLSARGSFDVSSDAGLLSGSLLVSGQIDSLSHSVSLLSEHIDLSKWTGKDALSSDLSGTLKAEGALLRKKELFATIQGDLVSPVLGNRSVKRLDFDLDLEPKNIGGRILLTGDQGSMDLNGDVVLSSEPWIEVTSQLTHFDLGPLLGSPLVFSDLNGRLSASTSLTWDHLFEGTLQLGLDSSLVSVRGDSSHIAPFNSVTTVRNPANQSEPMLDFVSDFATVQMNGTGSIPVWTRLALSWASGIQLAIEQENNKSLYVGSAADESFPDSPLEDLLLWEQARTSFARAGHSAPLEASIRLNILDAEQASTLMPSFPSLMGSVSISSSLVISPDTVSATTSVLSPSLAFGSDSMLGTEGSLRVGASRRSGISTSLAWDSAFNIDTLSVQNTQFSKAVVQSSFQKRSGFIDISSKGNEKIEGIDIKLGLNSTPRFNTVQFQQLEVRTADGFWSLSKPSDLRIYGDAISVSDFDLQFHNALGTTNQSIQATGVFTGVSDEKLIVTLSEISLRDLSGFANLKHILGGIVNTQIAFSGGLRQPILAGSAKIESFSIDHRILGDIDVVSNYQTGSTDTEVSLVLTPIPDEREAVLAGTDLLGERISNDLTLGGTVRLPSKSENIDSKMDLFLDIHRADLFFLKYIFSDAIGTVSGYLSGDGTIKGSFTNPLFDVKLGLIDGAFDVPNTQSQYQIAGDIRVDREAIHVDAAKISDSQGGFADLSGRILFNEYRFFSLDIGGRLSELQIMNVGASTELPFYGFLWASGDITLNGPLYDATLFSNNASTRANSELFIPIEEDLSETDESFIVFEDSVGYIPDFNQLNTRPSILASRPTAERRFLDGLNLDLSIFAPVGSTVHLVIDPLLGDVINAKSTGTVQLIRGDDEFQTFGQLSVDGGDYLFTAGELFFRRFIINEGGTITWDGDSVNAQLDIPASYKTRASRAGLPGADAQQTGLIPLIVNLQISGTVNGPQVDLSLSIDQANQNVLGDNKALEAQLNQPDRATEYATSVLLTNSFQLTTDNLTSDSGSQLAFNSVSQLVSAQLNRFLNEALPNVDFSFGLLGERAADLDVTYGVALRLLDERLIIRGEGVYQGTRAAENVRVNEGLQGEFVVEIRISPKVSVEVFFRREGDILETSELTNTTGVGVSYQTDFESWGRLFRRLTNETSETQ